MGKALPIQSKLTHSRQLRQRLLMTMHGVRRELSAQQVPECHRRTFDAEMASLSNAIEALQQPEVDEAAREHERAVRAQRRLQREIEREDALNLRTLNQELELAR